MDTQNVHEDEAESDTVTYLRRGGISILEAIAVKLPDVFTAEILPKLDVTDTLSLAQVNKAYNAAVWSADGVQSMKAKVKTYSVKIGKEGRITEPLYWAAARGNVPAVRALLESGVDVNKVLTQNKRTALHAAAQHGQVAVVQALIEAGADVNKKGSDGLGSDCLTALYIAVTVGQAPCVVELIKAGAHVKNGGCAPLFAAIIYGHEAIVGMLILAGADGGEEYGQLIAWAKKYKHENIAKLLEQFRA